MAAAIAIDPPIGAEVGQFRSVDAEARRFVGKRRNSIFETPPAGVLAEPTIEAALALSRKLTTKELSKQSYALREEVHEVAAIVQPDDAIIEVHPEVSWVPALWGTRFATPRDSRSSGQPASIAASTSVDIARRDGCVVRGCSRDRDRPDRPSLDARRIGDLRHDDPGDSPRGGGTRLERETRAGAMMRVVWIRTRTPPR